MSRAGVNERWTYAWVLHAELGALVHQLVGAQLVLNCHDVVVNVLVLPHVLLQHLVLFSVGFASNWLLRCTLAALVLGLELDLAQHLRLLLLFEHDAPLFLQPPVFFLLPRQVLLLDRVASKVLVSAILIQLRDGLLGGVGRARGDQRTNPDVERLVKLHRHLSRLFLVSQYNFLELSPCCFCLRF